MAWSAPPPIAIQSFDPDEAQPSTGPFGFLKGINRSSALLGDLFGVRTALARKGMSLSIQETSEYLGNTSGGTQRGFRYDGVTQVLFQMDTQRAMGHYGGLFNASVLDLHGRNLSAENIQALQTVSGIAGTKATRLWELWYSQKFLEEDRLNFKLGQISVDQEFMVSNNALYFVNTMFGWPMLPSADLPGGGPAYPLSAVGMRASLRPVDGVQILAGVFNGSPLRKDNGTDPQLQNRHGTQFATRDGQLTLVEAQFSYPALGSLVEPGQAQSLGWTYRLGAWYDSKQFADQRLDNQGVSLNDPASNGQAQRHSGNYAVYGVADQLIWRDVSDPNRTASVFARAMATPKKDRNIIDRSLNLGIVFKSPFRYRAADTLGIGYGRTHVSNQAARLDQDAIDQGNPGYVRRSEEYMELTYQYQLKPWIQLQPDVQFIRRVGAGAANPNDPSRTLGNAWVVGIRTNISF